MSVLRAAGCSLIWLTGFVASNSAIYQDGKETLFSVKGSDSHAAPCVAVTLNQDAGLHTGKAAFIAELRHLTARSDVYSFGVVLLEILTGRRAVDKNKPGGEQNLVEWAKPYLNDKRKVFRIIDPRLEGQYSMKGAHRVATLAFSCLYADPRMRPLMKDIVELLEPLLNTREVAKCAYNAGCDPSIRTHPKDSRLYVHNGRRAYNGVYQNGLAQQHQNGNTDGRKNHQQSTKHGDVRQRHGVSPQAAYQMKRPQDPCPKLR